MSGAGRRRRAAPSRAAAPASPGAVVAVLAPQRTLSRRGAALSASRRSHRGTWAQGRPGKHRPEVDAVGPRRCPRRPRRDGARAARAPGGEPTHPALARPPRRGPRRHRGPDDRSRSQAGLRCGRRAGGARGRRARPSGAGAEAGPARPDDVHDRSRRARSTSTTPSPRRRSATARRACGCTSPTSPLTCRRGRLWTARRAGGGPACTCPGPSSRCCRMCSRATPAHCVPATERPAVTVELELRGASVTRTAFYRSLIRSDVCLDYDRVDRIFAGAGAGRPAVARAAASCARGRRGAAGGAGARRRARRRIRGARILLR